MTGRIFKILKLFSALVLLTICSTFVQAQEFRNQELIIKLFEDSQSLYEQGKYMECAAKLHEIIGLNPDYAMVNKLYRQTSAKYWAKILQNEQTRDSANGLDHRRWVWEKRRRRSKDFITLQVKSLESSDHLIYRRAQVEIFNIGHFVMPYMVEHLKNKLAEEGMRTKVNVTLQELAATNSGEGVLPLIELLDSKDPLLIENVAIILAHSNDKRALAPLKKVYENKNYNKTALAFAKNAIQFISEKKIKECPDAKDLYYDKALRYLLNGNSVIREAEVSEGVIYRYRDGDKLESLNILEMADPRFGVPFVPIDSWHLYVAEEAIYDAMDLDLKYEKGIPLLLCIFYAQFNQVENQLKDIDRLIERQIITEDDKTLLELRKQRLVSVKVIGQLAGKKNLYSALELALKHNLHHVAVTIIDNLKNVTDGDELNNVVREVKVKLKPEELPPETKEGSEETGKTAAEGEKGAVKKTEGAPAEKGKATVKKDDKKEDKKAEGKAAAKKEDKKPEDKKAEGKAAAKKEDKKPEAKDGAVKEAKADAKKDKAAKPEATAKKDETAKSDKKSKKEETGKKTADKKDSKKKDKPKKRKLTEKEKEAKKAKKKKIQEEKRKQREIQKALDKVAKEKTKKEKAERKRRDKELAARETPEQTKRRRAEEKRKEKIAKDAEKARKKREREEKKKNKGVIVKDDDEAVEGEVEVDEDGLPVKKVKYKIIKVMDGVATPLVKALDYRDERVTYEAAMTIAHLNPVKEFPGSEKVVSLLAKALGEKDQVSVLVIDSNNKKYPQRNNEMTAILRQCGFLTISADTSMDGIMYSRSFPSKDLILIAGDLKGRNTERVFAELRADYRTKNIPVGIIVDKETKVSMAERYAHISNHFFSISDGKPAIIEKVRTIMKESITPRSAQEEKTAVAIKAAEALAAIKFKDTIFKIEDSFDASIKVLMPPERIDEIRLPVLKALANFKAVPSLKAVADTYLNDINAKAIRLAALYALGEIGPNDKVAFAALLKAIAIDNDLDLRVKSSEDIGKASKGPEKIIELLQSQRIKKDLK